MKYDMEIDGIEYSGETLLNIGDRANDKDNRKRKKHSDSWAIRNVRITYNAFKKCIEIEYAVGYPPDTRDRYYKNENELIKV